jgi:predicted transcriptional regulator
MEATMPTVTPMSLRLDTALRDRLERIAQMKKRSSHALARDAVIRFVAEEEKAAAWNASCETALHQYQETGLHITRAETDAWLDTWGTSKETPGPECHE